VRSDLSDFTFKNTNTLFKEIARILNEAANNSESFITVSQGIF